MRAGFGVKCVTVCDILLSKRCLERGIFNPDFVKQLVTDHLGVYIITPGSVL
jgi:hypothetical protein